MDAITYVHGDTEVVMTGRVAKRKIEGRRGGKDRVEEKVEITPKDKEEGSWKKFVNQKELFEITDEE